MIAAKNGELVVLPVTQEMKRAHRAYRLEKTNAGLPESAYALN
ncbi:hypothetical protein [Paracoccus sp. S-4012]|nr:hypothetical protein [Paracoccus sp. S-4012]